MPPSDVLHGDPAEPGPRQQRGEALGRVVRGERADRRFVGDPGGGDGVGDHAGGRHLVGLPPGQADRAARPQHTVQLGQCRGGVGNVIDDEISGYCVKLLVIERQLGQRRRPDRRGRITAGGQRHHARIDVHGRHLGPRRQRRRRHHPGATARVEQAQGAVASHGGDEETGGVGCEAGEAAVVGFGIGHAPQPSSAKESDK